MSKHRNPRPKVPKRPTPDNPDRGMRHGLGERSRPVVIGAPLDEAIALDREGLLAFVSDEPVAGLRGVRVDVAQSPRI